MIKSPQELVITEKMVSNFQDRMAQLTSIKDPSEAVSSEILAIKVMISDLNMQIKWYNDTIDGRNNFNSVNSLAEIPMAIVGKRLQLNLSSSDLAQDIGISEDDYINLENDDFYGVESSLLDKIFKTLDIENTGNILNNEAELNIETVETNLQQLKINKALLSQIMPITFEDVKAAIRDAKQDAYFLFSKFIEAFNNYFSIDLRNSFSEQTIENSFAVAFKRRVNINVDNLNFTTSFAAHIALIISKQLKASSLTIKADPISIRSNIIKYYGEISLESCLEYIWDLNLAVLPLDIKSGFHGACFDFEDRKVIVLNQQTDTVSRWKFDLLHELYHALTMDYNAYIERIDIMQQNEGEEKSASDFASFVIFGQEVESFVKIVLDRSKGNAELIKSSIIDVAKQFRLNVDDFSNYVAYRISTFSISFWGTAANIQIDKRSAREITRNYLLRKLDYNAINANDLFVLQKSIIERVIF